MAVKEAEVIVIEGNEVMITNPNKTLWPDEKITKLQYLQKLIFLAPYLLRYCKNRYLTTIRFPDGIGSKSFYQKNCPEPIPDFVKTAELNQIQYVNLDSLSTLLWLGNLGCLEFHPSLHFIQELRPAEWIIDIDPTLEDDPRLTEAVSIVGGLLQTMRIQSSPKTSGATGMQIYIPILPLYTFDQLQKVGQFMGEYLSKQYPDLFTIERLKKHRGKRIYFDYLQHGYGKTLAAPYTPRARERAPVSTPLLWEELQTPIQPRDYNLHTIEARLQSVGDLIEQIPPQSLHSVLEYLENT